MAFNRDLSVSIAKLAEQAQRYDDMAEVMKNVAKSVVELTADERILLSTAFKKKISSAREFWKMLFAMNDVTGYREKVEAEINDICRDILSILDQHLIPSCKSAGDPTSGPFYYKMKGDYYMYLAEFKSGNAKREANEEAFKAYESTGIIPRSTVSIYKTEMFVEILKHLKAKRKSLMKYMERQGHMVGIE